MIEQFTVAWNKHLLPNAQNWLPEQIWVNGMIDQRNRP